MIKENDSTTLYRIEAVQDRKCSFLESGAITLDHMKNSDMISFSGEDTSEIEDLSGEEETQLAECELIIEQHRESFINVCLALGTILRNKLYRKTHHSFGDYCHEKIGISRSHGYRLVKAGELVEKLSPTGDIDPEITEHQLRKVSSLSGTEQNLVIEEFQAKTGAVTRDDLTEAIKKRADKKEIRPKNKKVAVQKTCDNPPCEPILSLRDLKKMADQAVARCQEIEVDEKLIELIGNIHSGLTHLTLQQN